MANPFDYIQGVVQRNPYGISNAFAGLANGGLGGFAAGAVSGAPADKQLADQKAAQAKAEQDAQIAQQLKAKYTEFFTKQGRNDYAQAVADGLMAPGDAYKDWMQSKTVAADKPTASIQEYNFAKQQGYTGTFQQYETEMKRAGATNLTFNGDQANAAGFADRMKAAEPVIQQTESSQTDLGQAAKSMIPGVGNYLVTPEFQQAQQAQRDFVNALLRKESGAAISDQEFENARKQYFPQPGDSPQVIEQKRQNRAIAIASMERSGGPAYNNPNAAGSGVPQGNTTSTGVQWSVGP